MWKAPVQTHSGLKIRLTNTFGPITPDSLLEWYKKTYGITEHLGIDLRLEGPRHKSYGTPILSLFPGYVYYEQFYAPFGKKSNGLRIISEDNQWRARYWHNSKHLVHWGDRVDQYQPIALMGNTGLVRPEPNFKDPYNGVHLHLTLEKRTELGLWKKVDPLSYINLQDTIDGPDTDIDNDIPPLSWVVSQASDSVQELLEMLKLKQKGQQGYPE